VSNRLESSKTETTRRNTGNSTQRGETKLGTGHKKKIALAGGTKGHEPSEKGEKIGNDRNKTLWDLTPQQGAEEPGSQKKPDGESIRKKENGSTGAMTCGGQLPRPKHGSKG